MKILHIEVFDQIFNHCWKTNSTILHWMLFLYGFSLHFEIQRITELKSLSVRNQLCQVLKLSISNISHLIVDWMMNNKLLKKIKFIVSDPINDRIIDIWFHYWNQLIPFTLKRVMGKRGEKARVHREIPWLNGAKLTRNESLNWKWNPPTIIKGFYSKKKVVSCFWFNVW